MQQACNGGGGGEEKFTQVREGPVKSFHAFEGGWENVYEESSSTSPNEENITTSSPHPHAIIVENSLSLGS